MFYTHNGIFPAHCNEYVSLGHRVVEVNKVLPPPHSGRRPARGPQGKCIEGRSSLKCVSYQTQFVNDSIANGGTSLYYFLRIMYYLSINV